MRLKIPEEAKVKVKVDDGFMARFPGKNPRLILDRGGKQLVYTNTDSSSYKEYLVKKLAGREQRQKDKASRLENRAMRLKNRTLREAKKKLYDDYKRGAAPIVAGLKA